MKTKEQLIGEIRYVIRLTQRTARLYRNFDTFGTILFIIGGSAALASLTDYLPIWITSIGFIFLTSAGAVLIAVRPADKAAQNEYDAKRYQALMSRAVGMNADELTQALEDARSSDTPEIESLRDVAYNDVVLELDRHDAAIPLSLLQKILKSMA